MKSVERQLVALSLAILGALGFLLASFYWPGVGGILATMDSSTQSPSGASNSKSDRAGSAGHFRVVGSESGFLFVHQQLLELRDIRDVMAPGVALADFDGDGLIDIFIANSGDVPIGGERRSNALFRNLGGMTFEPVAEAGGASSGERAMGATAADFDGDGDLDLYITALGPNRLYQNDGHGLFQDRASELGVADPSWSAGAAFADYDGDGDLDLYVANYVEFNSGSIPTDRTIRFDRDEPPAFSPYLFPAAPDVLYRNEGGRFTNVTESAGIHDVDGKGLGVLFADLNGDRRPDLTVINDVSKNAFLLNRGGGRFADKSVESGLDDPRSGMGVTLGDFDNDGRPDLFSTHWQDESNVLYRNLGGPSDDPEGFPAFLDDTMKARLAAPSIGATGWGTCWADFDQDGALDLVVVNGYTSPSPGEPSTCIPQPVMVFMNDQGRFTNRAAELGLGDLGGLAFRGAATADLDNDGDLDLVLTANNGPARLVENRFATGNWLKVAPVGGCPIGAVIRATANGRTQWRMLLAGTSYLSSEPPIAHFGLADAQRVEKLEVDWSDGRHITLKDVPVNQLIRVEPAP